VSSNETVTVKKEQQQTTISPNGKIQQMNSDNLHQTVNSLAKCSSIGHHIYVSHMYLRRQGRQKRRQKRRRRRRRRRKKNDLHVQTLYSSFIHSFISVY